MSDETLAAWEKLAALHKADMDQYAENANESCGKKKTVESLG